MVERDQILGADRVQPGDVVLACASSGLHSNGYSLAAGHAFLTADWLDRQVPELGRSLGEELLVPTRIYTPDLLALIDAVDVHAISHVTGGGLAGNLARVMSGSCEVRIDRTTWSPPPIFDLIAGLGKVSEADMESPSTWASAWWWCSSPTRPTRA